MCVFFLLLGVCSCFCLLQAGSEIQVFKLFLKYFISDNVCEFLRGFVHKGEVPSEARMGHQIPGAGVSGGSELFGLGTRD